MFTKEGGEYSLSVSTFIDERMLMYVACTHASLVRSPHPPLKTTNYASCQIPEWSLKQQIVCRTLRMLGWNWCTGFYCPFANNLVNHKQDVRQSTTTLCFNHFTAHMLECLMPSHTRLVGIHSSKLWPYIRSWAKIKVGRGGFCVRPQYMQTHICVWMVYSCCTYWWEGRTPSLNLAVSPSLSQWQVYQECVQQSSVW